MKASRLLRQTVKRAAARPRTASSHTSGLLNHARSITR